MQPCQADEKLFDSMALGLHGEGKFGYVLAVTHRENKMLSQIKFAIETLKYSAEYEYIEYFKIKNQNPSSAVQGFNYYTIIKVILPNDFLQVGREAVKAYLEEKI